jgi:hypothetical protein
MQFWAQVTFTRTRVTFRTRNALNAQSCSYVAFGHVGTVQEADFAAYLLQQVASVLEEGGRKIHLETFKGVRSSIAARKHY